MRFTFLQFLTEKYALDDCDYLVQAKTIDADPHEILTAFLCLDTSKGYLDDETGLSSQSGNGLLVTIKNIIKDISTCTKIIAVNDFKNLFSNLYDELAENKLSDKNIKFYKNIKSALPQAASAAIAIKSNFAKSISNVYLTGSSWPEEVKNFKISKHGMDGYNSSDIIVTDGRRYLGVSLKKKDKETDLDPTIINKSLFNLKVNERPLKDISGKDETGNLKDMFDTWFAEQITNASKDFTPEFIKVNCTKDAKNKNALLKLFNEKTLDKVNPELVNKFAKKILNTKGKKYFRDLINNKLKLTGPGSIFNSLKEFFTSKPELTDDLANQLVDLVFKPDLIELLNDTNPELPEFDFALCTGNGKTIKSKNNPISFKIDEANYYPITTISNVIRSLKGKSNKATFIIRDKTSEAAKLFLDLELGETIVANLEIRYKGSYSPSPQFLGTISEDFKEKIKKEIEKTKKLKKK